MNIEKEIWKPVVGYEGLYEVSSFGRVKSLGNGIRNSKKKILKPRKNKCGYLQIGLFKNGKVKRYYVHRLVASVFLPNPENFPCINHKDENKENNNVNNLEWCSYYYNNTFGSRLKKIYEKTTNGKCSKPVLQYTLSGDFIAEYPSSHEVQRQLGFLRSNISHCCLGKYKQAYGFIWKYKI